MNIILIGMMGCGKTTVAKELSLLIKGFEYVDIDEDIERSTQKKISVPKNMTGFTSCTRSMRPSFPADRAEGIPLLHRQTCRTAGSRPHSPAGSQCPGSQASRNAAPRVTGMPESGFPFTYFCRERPDPTLVGRG